MISRRSLSLLQKLLLLLFAVLVGLAVSEYRIMNLSSLSHKEFEEYSGLRRDKGMMLLKSPLSPFGVMEVCTTADTHKERLPGYVSVGKEDDSFFLFYTISEDALGVKFIDPHTAMLGRDTDADGQIDRIGLTIGNKADNGRWYNYKDLDRDGLIDQMTCYVDSQPEYTSLRIDNAWVRISEESDGLPVVIDGTGENIVYAFSAGEWHRQ